MKCSFPAAKLKQGLKSMEVVKSRLVEIKLKQLHTRD